MAHKDRRKHGHLLDDDNVRRWYQNTAGGSQITADVYLRRLGCFVDQMNTSLKALAGMSGKEAFARIKQIDPEVRVIMSTGCAWDSNADELLRDGALAILAKPYRERDLSQVVAASLRQPRHAGGI